MEAGRWQAGLEGVWQLPPLAWHWHMGIPPAPGATPGTVPPLWGGAKVTVSTVSTDYSTVNGSEDTHHPGAG